MPSMTRGLAIDASGWSLAPLLPAIVAPSGEDRPDDPAKSLGSGSGSFPVVHFLLQARGATSPAPFHRAILAPQNEAFLSARETPRHASAIDRHRALSASSRSSQRSLAEPRAHILPKHAKDRRNRPQ